MTISNETPKYTLVYSSRNNVTIGVILSETMQIPYFVDGCASDFCRVPLKLDDPTEWDNYFEGRLVYCFGTQDYKILNESELSVFERHKSSGFIPFDLATSNLRILKGLLAFADECYEEKIGFSLD